MTLIGSQSLKNININIYYGGPLLNPGEIDGFPYRGLGIECYYMMIRRKLKTLNDLKKKIMEELKPFKFERNMRALRRSSRGAKEDRS